MKNLIIAIIVATVFSSLTLWLIESWIKYPFFLLEIFIIIVLYLVVSGYDLKLSLKHFKIKNVHVGLTIDAFLIISASTLLIFNALHIQGGLIQLISALLSTSILSGYALLNIFGLTRHFSILETAVLSYVVSFAFTGFITLAILFLNENTRTLIILSSFIGVGLISAIKHKRCSIASPSRSFTKNIDSLALLLLGASYALSFYFMYPGFALLPGMDISQHYASSVVLWRAPELYSIFNYFLAHLHGSAFIAISNAPVTFIQTALVTLNFLMPLAFYAMAKSYLESIDTRLPVMSTIFFSLFSGFAWIYLAQLKLDGAGQTELSLLSLVNDKAYNGAMYLVQPSLWYVPLSVSFTMTIIQFMLLRKLNVDKTRFVTLFFLLTVASYMTHVTEAVVFSLFLSFYAFFSRSKTVRLNDALLASIIGFTFIDAFYAILEYPLGKDLGFSLAIPFTVTVVLAIVYAYRTLKVQDKLITLLPKINGNWVVRSLVYISTFFYLLGLATWVGGIPSFHTSMLVDVGALPWFIYPVLLGVVGILMMFSLYYLLENHKTVRLLMPFLALVIFSLLFGRTLTFINMNLSYTSYWEKRFTSYFLLASAVIAPIAMIKVVDSIRRNHARIKRTLLLATIVSIVTVYGLQSLFMVTEYWSIATAPAYQISEGEFQAINYLRGILQQDKYAYTITLTRKSYDALAFATPIYQLFGSQFFSTGEKPEIPLLCLKAHNYSHAYLYMHNRDYAELNKTGQSWLATHLLPILPVIYINADATIYNISSVSFPQTNSTTALVVPFDKSISPTQTWLYAYDTLSMGEYGYTTAYDLDSTIFSHDSLVLSIDPPSKNVIEKKFEDDFSAGNGWQPISGTWQYVKGGLEAGKYGEQQNAIFLSPVSAQNFTANINFKPLDGDTKVANYISLIFDWADQANFKYASLLFDSDGNVNTYFASYTNGQAATYPAWPGLKTGLKWQFGDSFNLTVSVQAADAVLYINDSQYLSMKSTMNGGLLGIQATRFYQVLFTGFEAVSANDVRLRNVDDYLDYVKDGGRLIVLNTNGCGYFADRLLTSDNLSITTNLVHGSRDIILPANLTVSKLLPKDDNIEVLAYYQSQENSSVYAAKEKIGAGEIIYVNIYPIVNAIDLSSNKRSFYELMGDLLKPTDQLEPFTYLFDILGTFKQATMSGNVSVSSSSLLFPLDVELEKLSVTFVNGSVFSLANVTRLSMSDYTNINVAVSNLTLSNGNGFYAALKFGDNVTIASENNSTVVIVTTADGNTTKFTNSKILTINDGNLVTIYMRQPTISAKGLIIFKELYSNGALYQKTQTQGQDLSVNGSVKIAIFLSDTYTLVSSLDASGSLERNPPLLAYNELSSLPQAVFWGILLTPVFLIILCIVQGKKNESSHVGDLDECQLII